VGCAKSSNACLMMDDEYFTFAAFMQAAKNGM
jgi:hypothetical protein